MAEFEHNPFGPEGIPPDELTLYLRRLLRGLSPLDAPSEAAEEATVGAVESPYTQTFTALAAEARVAALTETDPKIRLSMLMALVGEGHRDLALIALSTWEKYPYEGDEAPDINKAEVGAQLVETLAKQRLFDSAQSVSARIGRMDKGVFVESLGHMLRQGFAGRNQVYLTLDMTKAVLSARGDSEDDVEPDGIVPFLLGLAAYGIDVRSREHAAARLYPALLATTPQPIRRDWLHEELVVAYCDGGHLDKAVAMKDLIVDPQSRAAAGMHAAKATLDDSSESAVAMREALLDEVQDLMPAIASCNGLCGRPDCDPLEDVQALQADRAYIYARLGDYDRARQLLDPSDPVPNVIESQAFAVLYGINGNVQDRNAAIRRLLPVPNLGQRAIKDLVKTVGAADIRWGYTVQSPQGETVPRIYADLYGNFIAPRQNLGTEDVEERFDRIVGKLDLEDDSISPIPSDTTIRSELWSRGLYALAEVLANQQALETARAVVGDITSPVEKVRAKAALARMVTGG